MPSAQYRGKSADRTHLVDAQQALDLATVHTDENVFLFVPVSSFDLLEAVSHPNVVVGPVLMGEKGMVCTASGTSVLLQRLS